MSDIAFQDGLQISVDDGCRQAEKLADLGQDLGRQRHAHIRGLVRDDAGDALFMAGVEKGKQQADGDGSHAAIAKFTYGFAQIRFLQLAQHLALEVDPFRDLSGQTFGSEKCRFLVFVIEYRVAMRRGLFADLVYAPEPLGNKQCRLGALALQQGIGADRGAVTKELDIAWLHPLVEKMANARDNGLGWIMWR